MVYQYSYHSHLPIHPSIHPPTHPSSTHASAHLSIQPSTHPSSIHSSAYPSPHPSVYKPIYPIQQVASSTFLVQALFKDKILHDPALSHLISTTFSFPLVSVRAAFLGFLNRPSSLLLPRPWYWDSLWLNAHSCMAHLSILFRLLLRCPQKYSYLPWQLSLLCLSWTAHLWLLELISVSSISVPNRQAPGFSLSLVLHS